MPKPGYSINPFPNGYYQMQHVQTHNIGTSLQDMKGRHYLRLHSGTIQRLPDEKFGPRR